LVVARRAATWVRARDSAAGNASMNVKAFIPLVAGLCVGGFALKMGLSTLQKAKGTQGPTQQIWAAAANIPRGAEITAELLKPMKFPEELIPVGSFRDKEQLIGRVPHIEAPAGLPILENMLTPPGTPTGVRVPSGYRAVAVKIDEGSGVDYHIEPGSRVDVVGFFQLQEAGKRETVARTLIENVEVAAVGARLSAAEEDGKGKNTRQIRAVTLLVRPDKVPVLHLAEQRGKIKLSMRGNEDGQEVGTGKPVTSEQLLGSPAPREPQPAPQPSAMVMVPVAPEPEPEPVDTSWAVQVYRGDRLEVVRFQDRSSRARVLPAPTTTDQRSAGRRSGTISGPGPAAAAAPANPVLPVSAPPPPKANPAASFFASLFKPNGTPERLPEPEPLDEPEDQEPEEPTE
jgi:pilus assembly protein CpaB